MTFDQIISELQKKIYRPIYFLMGEEPYYIDLITDHIADNVLTESEKSFNQTMLYGKDVDVSAVINAARRYPMMANYQVVILKEAQNLKKLEDEFIHYAENPLKSTILVINYKYGSIDKRKKKLVSAIEKNGILFESKKIYESAVPDWITEYLKSRERTITHEANRMLVDFIGNDLSRIASELDKLMITLPQGIKQITPAHIEKNIGISKDFNVYELTKAMSVRDTSKCFLIASHLGANPGDNPAPLIFSTIFTHFQRILLYHSLPDKSNRNLVASQLRINPFFLSEYVTAAKNFSSKKAAQVISVVREYDMKSKGVDEASISMDSMLKEMVYKILR